MQKMYFQQSVLEKMRGDMVKEKSGKEKVDYSNPVLSNGRHLNEELADICFRVPAGTDHFQRECR